MPTLKYQGVSYDCATAIKGPDYIHLLDKNGVMVAAFDNITNFSSFTLENGSYTSPTADNNCYLAVIRDDGTFGKGDHKCSDIPQTASDVGAAPAGFGLGATAKLISNTNLIDTLKTAKTGWYRGTKVTNAPVETWCYFHVIADSADYAVVLAYPMNGGEYRALHEKGSLTKWVQTSVSTHKHFSTDVEWTVATDLYAIDTTCSMKYTDITQNTPYTAKLTAYATGMCHAVVSSTYRALFCVTGAGQIFTNFYYESAWSGWRKFYNEAAKPNAADVGAVPTTRKVNGHALSADISLSATDVGGIPVIVVTSATDDMDALLQQGTHLAFYKTGTNTLGTPFKAGLTVREYATILSYATSTSRGMQIAFCSGSDLICTRKLDGVGKIGEWGVLYTGNNKPTAEDVGAVSKTGDTMTGDLEITKSNGKYRLISNAGKVGELQLFANATTLSAYNSKDDTTTFRRLRIQDSKAQADINHALVFLNSVSGQVEEYPVIHTGNITESGVAKIETGSYVGSGFNGEEFPTEITFSFVPKVVWVWRSVGGHGSPGMGTLNEGYMIMCSTLTNQYKGAEYLPGVSNTWYNKLDGTTLSFYYGKKTWDEEEEEYYYPDALEQLNYSGYTYSYIAIG